MCLLIDHDVHVNADKTCALPATEYSVLLMHGTTGKDTLWLQPIPASGPATPVTRRRPLRGSGGVCGEGGQGFGQSAHAFCDVFWGVGCEGHAERGVVWVCCVERGSWHEGHVVG